MLEIEKSDLRRIYRMMLENRKNSERNVNGRRKDVYFCCNRKRGCSLDPANNLILLRNMGVMYLYFTEKVIDMKVEPNVGIFLLLSTSMIYDRREDRNEQEHDPLQRKSRNSLYIQTFTRYHSYYQGRQFVLMAE